MRTELLALFAFIALLGATVASAAPIYVIDTGVSGHGMVSAAKSQLAASGHTVTSGNSLADYSGYNQVWDLRYNGPLTASDVATMGTYLQNGGRLYLTGEHSGFDARNNSLIAFLSSVGAGTVTLAGEVTGLQPFTVDGQIVNSPNGQAGVSFNAARTVTESSLGFLVTETTVGSGLGSLVGWDFGDIAGSPNARILAGFDIEVFQNGQAWTENMSAFLSASAVTAEVPEPASIALWGLGSLGLAWGARRRMKMK